MNPIGSAPSLAAQHALGSTRRALTLSLERLATGQRINHGSDDPAGLITSENLRAVLAALDAETQTMMRADHVIATADSALGEISGMLMEAEALVIANANTAGLSAEERAANQLQIDSIITTVNRIAATTSFNGDPLLDGTATVTAGGASISIDRVVLDSIGEGSAALGALRAARSNVTTLRGELGAFSKYTIGATRNALAISFENLAAAESVIRDTDYASETANLARLLTQEKAGLTVLRIINQNMDRILTLLA